MCYTPDSSDSYLTGLPLHSVFVLTTVRLPLHDLLDGLLHERRPPNARALLYQGRHAHQMQELLRRLQVNVWVRDPPPSREKHLARHARLQKPQRRAKVQAALSEHQGTAYHLLNDIHVHPTGPTGAMHMHIYMYIYVCRARPVRAHCAGPPHSTTQRHRR